MELGFVITFLHLEEHLEEHPGRTSGGVYLREAMYPKNDKFPHIFRDALYKFRVKRYP